MKSFTRHQNIRKALGSPAVTEFVFSTIPDCVEVDNYNTDAGVYFTLDNNNPALTTAGSATIFCKAGDAKSLPFRMVGSSVKMLGSDYSTHMVQVTAGWL